MLDDFDFLDDDSLSDEEIIELVELEGLEPMIDDSLEDDFDDEYVDDSLYEDEFDDEADEDSDWAE
jgi:hypothetical protein